MSDAITLSTTTYDPLGSVRIVPDRTSDAGEISRRISRTKTLDGGYALHDGGHAISDRDMRIAWTADTETDYIVEHMARYYGQIVVSTRDGCYLAAISAFKRGQPLSRVDLMILERQSE